MNNTWLNPPEGHCWYWDSIDSNYMVVACFYCAQKVFKNTSGEKWDDKDLINCKEKQLQNSMDEALK